MKSLFTPLWLGIWISTNFAGFLHSQSAGSRGPLGIVEGQPTTIRVENPKPGEMNEFFDFADSSEWFQPAPMSGSRLEYRTSLAKRLGEGGLTQRSLIDRQYTLYATQVGKPSQRESENGRLVLAGKVGIPRPVNVLEWLLFQHQALRFPMIEHPTEFSAYILRGNGRIHIYMSGGDTIGTKLRHEVTERVALDVKAGMDPITHLHNHPFMFDRQPGDRLYTTEDSRTDVGGALAPSLNDVQALRRMHTGFGLRGATITNGLDTYEFKAVEFDCLSACD